MHKMKLTIHFYNFFSKNGHVITFPKKFNSIKIILQH
jgi:hypothetical protein